jgi:hypothetical protein
MKGRGQKTEEKDNENNKIAIELQANNFGKTEISK